MKTLHKRCAGLDVHKVEVVACLRCVSKHKVEREVRRFPTTTQGLLELADWLEGFGCTQVAMEATGVYWKPVWHILEGRFALLLANAAHSRRAINPAMNPIRIIQRICIAFLLRCDHI